MYSRDLAQQTPNPEPADTRPLVNLLIDQIEFADVLILNKTDRLPATERGELRALPLHQSRTSAWATGGRVQRSVAGLDINYPI